jgi:hypothetical protein
MALPLVGTSDCHRLWQLGTTYSLLEAEQKSIPAVFAAIRAHRVRVVTAPLQPLARLKRLLRRPALRHQDWTLPSPVFQASL